jgi:hypothetical protein
MLARVKSGTLSVSLVHRIAVFATVALVAACQSGGPTQDEIEAAKQTVDCDFGGERVVIRFTEGEARLLMADGTRINLYQVSAPTGFRYTNGMLDLRGTTPLELQLQRDRITMKMTCKQYVIPVKKE